MANSQHSLDNIKHLVNFRQTIHQNPELSGSEEFTAEALKRTIIKYQPDDIIDNIGGFGVAFIFKGKKDGPSIMFRADMDALPIFEDNHFDYASRTDGVSHQCGHDGHMTILVGLAEIISKNRPEKGRAILFFQPAEETGDGALAVINDPNFHRIEPDYCFSLHNVPGFPIGSIVTRSGTFTAASQGLVIKLFGKTSHAAEPDKGKSPAIAMAKIIEDITKLPEKQYLFSEFVLATVVHASLGTPTFGTTPGEAKILITLRSYNDNDMQTLIEHASSMIHMISNHEALTAEIGFTDVFPATLNNEALTQLVLEKARENKLELVRIKEPFPWAEDFAQFSQRFKSTMFGLGAGVEAPKLHSSDYDFPDEIIPPALSLYESLYGHYFKDK